MSTRDRHRHRPPRVVARRGDEQHRRRPERLRHQRHVAREPDVLLPVRRAGEAVGLLRPGERPLDDDRPEPPRRRPSPRSARSRGRAGSAARRPAGAARSPGSRRPAPAPRYRHGPPPARSPPRPAPGRYRSASGVGVGRHRDRRRRELRLDLADDRGLPGQALHLPDAEPDEHRHPEDAEEQAARSSGGVIESATSAGALQGQSAESGNPSPRRRQPDLAVPLRRPDQHPGAVVQREGLEHLRLRIEEPEEADPARPVELPLLGQVEAAGPRARGSRKPSPARARSPACPESSPCAPGASRRDPAPPRRRRGAAPARWRGTTRPGRRRRSRTDRRAARRSGSRPRVTRRRARMEVQRAAHQLGDHVRQARRGRPGRSPAGGSSSRACSAQDPQM